MNASDAPRSDRSERRSGNKIGKHLNLFTRDENGALIIFGVFIFGLMLAIAGLSFDLMRYESHRVKLQATADRAALAAASLTQSVDPQAVVDDYFAKAGLSEYLSETVVTETTGSRHVKVDAVLNMPLHHGNFGMIEGGPGKADTMVVETTSAAREAIGNVEISLVLDVSSSMNRYNRINNLRVAAGEFLDIVYGASEPDTVSTSIVPFSMQVNAGAVLLSHFNAGTPSHDYSYCINFDNKDYESTSISTSAFYEQALHFDYTTDENDGWELGDGLRKPNCRPDRYHQITPWSVDHAELKTHVAALQTGSGTSNEIGIKWGAALLDPGLRDVVNSMIASGDVDPAVAGRPYKFDDRETMKILVVMTDGANSWNYYIDPPYRVGHSKVFRYGSGSDVQLSIKDEAGQYYRVNDDEWAATPYGDDDAVRLRWSDLWSIVPVEYYADEILARMGESSGKRNHIKNAKKRDTRNVKDTRMSRICSATKDEGIIVFAVGYEIGDREAALMESCASSPANFFRVEGADLAYAFRAIATQITLLRLVN